MTPFRAVALLLLTASAACGPAPAPGTADGGPPYVRIVTLAPSLAELVFAAGAGDALVGVSAWTTQPPEARSLPQVGDAFTVDRERLALLDPDLVLAWQGGTPEHVADELRQAGYNVAMIRTQTLEDISTAIGRIGELAGTVENARDAVAGFAAGIDSLDSGRVGGAPVRVFYEVSARPLYTVGGGHYISELIEICGGENVFADVTELAPAIDVESVVDRDPEAIVVDGGAGPDAFEVWDRWPDMLANRRANHIRVPDELGRPTPRVVGAARELCASLDEVRARRPQAESDDGT